LLRLSLNDAKAVVKAMDSIKDTFGWVEFEAVAETSFNKASYFPEEEA
jgi:hypothetical protein